MPIFTFRGENVNPFELLKYKVLHKPKHLYYYMDLNWVLLIAKKMNYRSSGYGESALKSHYLVL